jgi:farnesol dehydrogenase
MKSKIYITGATGRIGRAVMKEIPEAVPLVRKASGLENEVVADFTDSEELKRKLKDASVLIHIAGSVKTYDKEDLWKSNLELTERLIGALPPDARIIFASTISVYGKKLVDLPADEETPVNPDTEYAKSKYEAEKLVRGYANHVILRMGTVYGPGFDDYFYVLKLLENGKMKIIGDGKNRIPFVHVEDISKVFAAAVSKGKGTYVVTGECRTQREIYQMACRELGVEEPKKKISMLMADIAAMINELKARLTGKALRITREHIAILGSDRCFNCNRVRRELGFHPRSIEEGIAEIVGLYRKRSSTEL